MASSFSGSEDNGVESAARSIIKRSAGDGLGDRFSVT